MEQFEAEDRDALRDSAKGLLDRHSGSTVVRALLEENPPRSNQTLWKELVALGWPGLLVPEEFGGIGVGMRAAAIVLEELGGHTACTPFLSSSVLATWLLSNASDGAAPAHWLPRLALGQALATTAITGPAGRVNSKSFDLTARVDGQRLIFTGTARLVLDAKGADVLVAGGIKAGSGMPMLAAIPMDSPAITHIPVDSIDRTQLLSNVLLEDVVVEGSQVVVEGEAAVTLIDGLQDVAAIALSADALGAAKRALNLSIDYAKERIQFGRAIGSFQAIKHKLADMYLLAQASEAAVEGASIAFDLDRSGSRRRIAATSTFVRPAAARITGDAIQTHGGIGFTWEHECHLLFKRAKLDELLLSDSWAQRERLAAVLMPAKSA